MEVSERRSSPRDRALRAVYTPLQMSGELHREIRNYRAEIHRCKSRAP